MSYADIIVDISHENLDKSYQYSIPEEFREEAVIGALVIVPFGKGNRFINGYIVGLSETPKWKVELIKPIHQIVPGGLVIESQLISLAYWIKETFGATMNDALKTVIPVKKSVKSIEKKTIRLAVSVEEAENYLEVFKKKNNKGRVRLLEAFLGDSAVQSKGIDELEYELAVNKLNIARTTIQDLEKMGVITTEVEKLYRNPLNNKESEKESVILSREQQFVTEEIIRDYNAGKRKTYLIHGVTGSGKTEVYLEIISSVIKQGKKVIMLIPEIALTYQTVMRFYKRFGSRISIMNSRLSQGERYDQFMRAKNGDIDIMIGPRSALFTPFKDLGLIIMDEEHEGSYKSENPPKYHAREVAIKRGELSGASIILGSATPSLESYKKALQGEYKLFTLPSRNGEGRMPKIWIEDLREELKKKNKSIFSLHLKDLIKDRLNKKEQIILFINRRGYAGFVSCRSCGYVMKCPHCDVSLTAHNNGTLVCHYCGHEEAIPTKCPSCGSKYIAAFGTGTQKVEELVKREFPEARVLRMDTDTTKTKDGHEKILSAFANQEADILVGTQMIVKGHDFPMVTLVGILAADLSLYASDYRAAERTYQLLVQASGRAGRGRLPGEVVIQTYQPEHYSISAASNNDYDGFYNQEMNYRDLLKYPPAAHILAVLITSKDENKAIFAAKLLGGAAKEWVKTEQISEETIIIGPALAVLSKANDFYRYMIYVKQSNYNYLILLKNYLEGYINFSEHFETCNVQFDFNPMNSY
ncbi:replication restart helicase PriA [Anaerocolumna sp. MB42-C2]|uniref:replication restart helicase PriA n=1 Tax=Anaerocolumna sp. MB42-C2 TaxID=3070997 RepID=UPI0027DFFC67|nr:primosomal protein N' [Anaerocolumna sp. MB42-C2]WMJ88489.1 primosomal protein N' [Anaerocolumna sp. MB42-C2]